MKEISFYEATVKKYALINLDSPEKGYEDYDFHKGSKCYINGYPFQLMYENGEFSFEAEAIYLTASPQKKQERVRFAENEIIGILVVKNSAVVAYEFKIPSKVRQQSFRVA